MSRLSRLPTGKSLVKESTVRGNPTMTEVVAGAMRKDCLEENPVGGD